MSTDYVYGVFQSKKELTGALTELAARGIEATVEGGAGASMILMRPAFNQEPVKNWFIGAGTAGALMGGLAGALTLPAIPYNGYQVLTPMMAMVSGAILCAYFAVWIWGFLNGLDLPADDSGVAVQSTEGEPQVLTVRPENAEKKLAAMHCLEKSGAICVVARTAKFGPLETMPVAEPAVQPENTAVAVAPLAA